MHMAGRCKRKKTAYSHSGGTSGFTSFFERIPKEDFCMAVLSNVDFAQVHLIGDGMRSIVFDMKYDTPKRYVAIQADPSSYKDFEGQYELQPGLVIAIEREGEYLTAQVGGKNSMRLMPCAKDQFFYTQFYATITFSRDESGTVTYLVLHQYGKIREAGKLENRRAGESN